MIICSRPECQTTAGCKCVPLAGTGAILPYMAHLMNDARETIEMRDKRIAELTNKVAHLEDQNEKLKVDLKAALLRERDCRKQYVAAPARTISRGED